jgi:uncharacterized protein YijF (DUF1287 family)
VVIRALRKQGVDLQKKVHIDMKQNFAAYPTQWGLKDPDPNIDHRRVGNLMTYFDRTGYALKISSAAKDYATGDIVAWDLGKKVLHVGIISDRKTATGVPLVLHNIGRGTQEEDILFAYRVIGRYRL